ncbi:hypothetical protein [Clostridium chrysemydis]|uniref:hypothetical protein n=1 Tax=Clostridium chrysemydis TaxID=2665504 RepID=UPI001883CB34|nr:hypothetical protein [Clostridium chrysemydis]
MKNKKKTKNCSCNKDSELKSKVPNDGTFISPSDSSFSQEGTVRYGEEQDADDL